VSTGGGRGCWAVLLGLFMCLPQQQPPVGSDRPAGEAGDCWFRAKGLLCVFWWGVAGLCIWRSSCGGFTAEAHMLAALVHKGHDSCWGQNDL
jgi:hypothetical protein